MKLYYFPTDNSFKVLAVAHTLGIDLDLKLERVDLLKGEQFRPEFLGLNPNHRVPVLEDGDFVLWESNAIMQYLCERHPGNTLWPADARTRADVSRWQCWQLAHWGPPCATLAFERAIRARLGWGEPEAAEMERAEEQFHAAAKVLERHLQGRDWLVGAGPTLADFAVGAPLTFAEAARYPLEPYAEIRRWYVGLAALPAWQRALAHGEAPAADRVAEGEPAAT